MWRRGLGDHSAVSVVVRGPGQGQACGALPTARAVCKDRRFAETLEALAIDWKLDELAPLQ
eukprot:7327674-Lingulodinium_polyedra.AAC.1